MKLDKRKSSKNVEVRKNNKGSLIGGLGRTERPLESADEFWPRKGSAEKMGAKAGLKNMDKAARADKKKIATTKATPRSARLKRK